jgi:AcrR family transcriptional regulator
VNTSQGLRESKKEQTRTAIARAALALFVERGFERVSIAEIASAAGVSKMTVFNYFPAKEDMFFAFTHGTLPDFAGAVAALPARGSVVDAVHHFVRSEFERRAEWTGLHEGAEKFTKMIRDSPTLMAGYARQWRALESSLIDAVSHAADVPRASIPNESPTRDAVRVRTVVAQILAVVQTLVLVNESRQLGGMDGVRATKLCLLECDDAFELLATGLKSYP